MMARKTQVIIFSDVYLFIFLIWKNHNFCMLFVYRPILKITNDTYC